MEKAASVVFLALLGCWTGRAQSGSGPTPEFQKLRKSFETPAEAWKPLFNGKDLTGWKPLVLKQAKSQKPNDWEAPVTAELDPADETRLKRAPYKAGSGAPAFMNNARGTSCDLITEASFRDLEVYVEFMIPRKSNSGVSLMGNYEIAIQDSYGKKEMVYGDTGGVYAFALVGDKRGPGSPPKVNASRAPGQWESLHIWFRAPRFDASGKKVENARVLRVEHNGVLVQEGWELTGTTRHSTVRPWDERAEAPLLVQGDHGGVAFRNIYVRPLR
jgi:hypothetical protein